MRPRRCDLRRQLVDVIHDDVTFTVAERTFAPRTGFESAFQRDRRPCTAAERQATRDILASVRSELIALVSELSDPLLDWEDPERVLPSYASWRSVRQLAWHVVDTESRYYLPCTGLGYREPTESLFDELVQSAAHVDAVVQSMPADVVRTTEAGEVWTSTKLLRRLAWHERGELAVMRDLAAKARRALGK